MPDGPADDYFATQFATSIVQESGGEGKTVYWWGRLIRYLDTNEYVFRNFFGIDYTEKEFRAKYETGKIKITRFDISNVEYTVDPTDPNSAVVTMNAHIEAMVDGADKVGDFMLTHKVKKGWQAYESELS